MKIPKRIILIGRCPYCEEPVTTAGAYAIRASISRSCDCCGDEFEIEINCPKCFKTSIVN